MRTAIAFLPAVREGARQIRSQSTLRLLVVDGYQQKNRDEFERVGLTFASDLYKAMLVQQAPGDVCLEFETLVACQQDYEPPTDAALAQFDGACFTGSSMSAYSTDDDCIRQVTLMKRLLEQGVSTFGSCWGIQIAAVALGGAVELNPKGREVGIGRKIGLTAEGRDHAMFRGKKHVFEAFMSHGDEVTIVPPGAVVTAGNDHSAVQAMAVKHGDTESWFVQYHPEYDPEYFAGLIAIRKDRMCQLGFFNSHAEIDTYVEELSALHKDPTRKSLRWKYGVDEDVLDDDLKRVEIRNWLDYISSRSQSI